MSVNYSKTSKTWRNGLLLIGVYALNLLFFQAMMASPGFTDKAQNNHVTAGFEYRMLLKHIDKNQNSDIARFELPSQTTGIVASVLLRELPLLQAKPTFFYLYVSAFKRYRLLQVFLI